VCSAGFEASDVAATLNRLTVADICGMREAARRAAANLNADIEMNKILALYQRLLEPAAAQSATRSS
jgi:hypothetical protein